MAYRNGIVLSLGLVTAIVNIETAIEKPASLTTVCCGPADNQHAPTKIQQKTHCSTCGGEAQSANLKKARQQGESFVIVEQDEVAGVKNANIGATKKLINLTAHPSQEVDENTLQGTSTYFLVPSDVAQQAAYSLLLDTLDRHPEVAMLGEWTAVSRPGLFQVKVFDSPTGKVLVLEGRSRTESIKSVEAGLVPVDESLQAQLDSILPALVKPYDEATYSDTYAEGLANLLASREAVEGVIPDAAPAGPRSAAGAGSVDLTATLAAMAAQMQPAVPAKKAPARKKTA